METEKEIDLETIIQHGETALVGRQNGLDYKKKLEDKGFIFKDLEGEAKKIVISIPGTIVTMNKSFFLAIWADRILELGEDTFKEKYSFKTSEHIKNKIKGHINSALLTLTQAEILGVS